MKYKSCKDVESSLYIAPNEIRSCCQRFFYKDKMRGDAKLLEIDEGKTPTANDIANARSKIFDDIQLDKNESCLGCPFLYETNEKPKFNSQIKHLSIEHHSVCNLRCSYCSDIYYGGKRSKYNVVEFIKYLNASGSFEDCKQVVWGGGEPTLDKSFELIVEEINKYANPNLYHRVFTNAIIYKEAIQKFLKKGLIKIVTSVDAGDQKKFKEVRGRDKFINLFDNLKLYADTNPNLVTIKYILTKDNYDHKQLTGFVNECVKNKLENCNYQISMNYKIEELEINFLKSIIFLMSQMKKHSIYKFFIDDHIAARFISLDSNQKKEIDLFIKTHNFENILINKSQLNGLNIFGAGDIATNILNKSSIIEDIKNIQIFDNDISKIGTKIGDILIDKPKNILNNNEKIYISVAQSFDDVFSYLISLKINPNRIISGLII